MREKITIDVTAEDIAYGRRDNCWRCPIALAVNRAFGTQTAWVDQSQIEVRSETFNTPTQARDFICRFDKQQHVQPFTFEIELASA